MAMSKVFLVACWSITTLIVALALSACQPAATIADPPPAAAAPKNDWVAEIRRLAAAEKSYIEVLPLSDPAVTDLRGAARLAEAERRYDDVEMALAAALALTPEDPDLWQWRAENDLAQARWPDARRHARHSARIGPRLGALCVRNWLTLRAVAEETGESVAAARAQTRASACTVPAPVRL
ncbi:MAG: hypothetical protein COS34_14835 [Lysobacterales bacterium CG02_land_8_20_14_3_00_62_12]|nr:MAG: hypothetical protein COS34_14835 [Xanthomonadales bacterium CG02_land_8_20_14_3_00_62_12]